ncbi:MAG: aldehyde dehydrogenase [Solirubrobacterales bacterium]|nr:aldehyde dehydrogenase [Solirubrobacterales bacterium]
MARPTPNGRVISRDPWTGETVYEGRAASAMDVAGAVDRAHAGAERWKATPIEERAAALRAFAAVLRADADRLAGLIVAEVGKLRGDAEGEVEWAARTAEFYASHPPPSGRAGGASVIHRPLGVVAAITPWNVPLVTPAWKWLPALMAGNAVLWKPSELATGIAVATHEGLLSAGIPEEVFGLVPGPADTGRALCEHDRVAAVHFTGSETTGRAIAALLAPRLARCALELSGLNPAVVFADADLEAAAGCIVACATSLAGQKCTSTRRVLVQEAAYDRLVDRLGDRLDALRPGDPRDPETSLGPLITPLVAKDVEATIEAAVARGARIAARSPAGAPGPGGWASARAALLVGLASDDPLRTHELFAPVLSVEPFTDRADAWRLANDSPYGLSAAVYASDPALLAEAPARLHAGIVALNRRGDEVALEAPFGGHKRSGNGQVEGGEWAYAAVTDLQAVYGAGRPAG